MPLGCGPQHHHAGADGAYAVALKDGQVVAGAAPEVEDGHRRAPKGVGRGHVVLYGALPYSQMIEDRDHPTGTPPTGSSTTPLAPSPTV